MIHFLIQFWLAVQDGIYWAGFLLGMSLCLALVLLPVEIARRLVGLYCDFQYERKYGLTRYPRFIDWLYHDGPRAF